MSSSSSSNDSDKVWGLRWRVFKLRRLYRKPKYQCVRRLAREYYVKDETFAHYFGLSKIQFRMLLRMVARPIRKYVPPYRQSKPLRIKDRLALCLRFLASGRSFRRLSNYYDLKGSVVENIIKNVAKVLLRVLQPFCIPTPTTESWRQIATGFHLRHDMPNCAGALTSMYVKLRREQWMLFLALVDVNYKIILVDIGDYSLDPQSIWDNTILARRLRDNDLGIPISENVDGFNLPYVVVCGKHLPSQPPFLTKFEDTDDENNDANDAKKIFNCRIDPIIETAVEASFRMRSRWRLLRHTFPVPPYIVERMILTICCLENHFPRPITFPDQPETKKITNARIESIRKTLLDKPLIAKEKFQDYFLSPVGRVPWQYELLK